MMPASSNSFTVRYTVEIEILSSTATQRRYSSSTSGWSSASARTRAMTRRCSVMRMPVAAQRASIPETWSSDDDFNAVMGLSYTGAASSATARMLRQVASHQKRIQMFPAGLSIITLAASDHGKSGLLIKTPCRPVVLFDLEKYLLHTA